MNRNNDWTRQMPCSMTAAQIIEQCPDKCLTCEVRAACEYLSDDNNRKFKRKWREAEEKINAISKTKTNV